MLIMNNLHAAFEVDALTSSHPLSASPDDIQTPSEIFEMFDEISYSKVEYQSVPRNHWNHMQHQPLH